MLFPFSASGHHGQPYNVYMLYKCVRALRCDSAPPIHVPYVFQHWLCAAASASAVIVAADDDDGRCHTIAIPACLPACLPYNKTGQKLLFYDGLTGCESAFPFGRDNRVQAKNYSVSRVYLVHQKA